MTHPLQGKSVEELREVAKHLNIKPHPRAKAETILKQIMQQPQAYVNQATAPKIEKPAPVVHNNTEEEIREAIKQHLAKPGFSAEFPGDGTWIFAYKGCEESGNMAIPLSRIKVRAEFVAKGKRALMGLPGEFDANVAKGYANTVIMG